MKKLVSVISLFNFILAVAAQVKIGTNPSVINSFSVLELESSNKGLLLPRIATATDLALMAGAPEGMIVYFEPDASLYIKQGAA